MAADFYDFSERINNLQQNNLYRNRLTHEGPQSIHVQIGAQRLLNFCSNDYLGLARHPALTTALKAGADHYGVGGGASHLLSGHTSAHQQLEEELAEFTGRDKALLFSTGYMANLGVISALLQRGDLVLQDRLNHASLIDGAILARARIMRYAHQDVMDLRNKLANCQNRALIVSDTVFSMDGDIADVPALAILAQQYRAGLLLDDAHGFGVLGERGAGSVEHFGLSQQQAPLLMATLGKACGGFGAFVAGPAELIDVLLQSARTYIYTTAMPSAMAEANRAAIRVVQTESWRRQHLQTMIQRFRLGAGQLSLPIMNSNTAIQPLLIGGSEQVLAVSKRLFEKGFWVGGIRPPTVPANTGRLRISLSANHQAEHIDALLSALAEVLT